MSDCDCHKRIAILEAELDKHMEAVANASKNYHNSVKAIEAELERLRGTNLWLEEQALKAGLRCQIYQSFNKAVKYHLRAYGQRKINADQLEAELWELIEGEK